MEFSFALDHTQIAMPPARELDADAFYRDILGFQVQEKPPVLAARGGRWYRAGSVSLHLGVDPNFAPSLKTHVALMVTNYDALLEQLALNGVAVEPNDDIAGVTRCYVRDPFMNRIELIAST